MAYVGTSSAPPATVLVTQEPHHHLVLQNDYVEVLHVKLAPGESTLTHTHPHDGAADQLTDAIIAQQKPGEAEGPKAPTKPGDISARTVDIPFTHIVHNVGNTELEVLDVEFLQRPAAPSSALAGPVAAENPSARVYRWKLAPGESSPQHSHSRPYLIVCPVAMQLKMTAPDGRSRTEHVKAGDFHWVDAKVTHALTNAGTEPGEIVEMEMK